jgi:hypothetical protein
MAVVASATFWPAGAAQAAGAGVTGGVVAVVAWLASIPVLSGLLVAVGALVVAMAVHTFIRQVRTSAKAR